MDLSLFPIPESEQRRARGLRLANKAQRTNDLTMASSAILLLTPLADVDCVDIPALDALASSYELIGDVTSAQTLLIRALKLAPRNESVLQGLLTNSQHRGQPEESLRYLNKLHQLYPDDGRIVYQLAQILNQLGRTTEAWEAVEKAVQLLPNDLTVRAAAVQLARKLGQTEVADAQQAIIDRMLSATAAASAGNLQPSSKDR